MLTADELAQVCDVLIEHENLVPWLYCDSRGFVTVGVGDKVTASTVVTMPFVHRLSGEGASTGEKLAALVRVQDTFRKGFTASAYRACSDLRLSAAFCRRRLEYRVKAEFVPTVLKHCPQAASFPTAAKLCLVDIAYNVGVVGFGRFQHLIAGCNSLHFFAVCDEVHTDKEDEDPKDWRTWGKRNKWRRDMMILAGRDSVTPVLT